MESKTVEEIKKLADQFMCSGKTIGGGDSGWIRSAFIEGYKSASQQIAEKDKEIEINIPELVDEFMDGFEDPFTRGEMFKSQTSAHSINIAYYFELAMEYALLHRQDLINNQKL